MPGGSFLVSTRRWRTLPRSPDGWHRCANASGWSTPSARSPAPRRCWRTCRATRTGWPSPTAGSSRFQTTRSSFATAAPLHRCTHRVCTYKLSQWRSAYPGGRFVGKPRAGEARHMQRCRCQTWRGASSLASRQQHRIAIAEETVALRHRVGVKLHHLIVSGEGAHQHHQGAFG